MKDDDAEKKKLGASRGDIHRGDHVYFNHPSGPRSGKVVCHGRHGCTVECDNEQHRVKWHNVLGHKSKVDKTYKVVEEGHDGMIVEDETGKRRFVGSGKEEKPKKIMVKSLGQYVKLIRSK